MSNTLLVITQHLFFPIEKIDVVTTSNTQYLIHKIQYTTQTNIQANTFFSDFFLAPLEALPCRGLTPKKIELSRHTPIFVKNFVENVCAIVRHSKKSG